MAAGDWDRLTPEGKRAYLAALGAWDKRGPAPDVAGFLPGAGGAKKRFPHGAPMPLPQSRPEAGEGQRKLETERYRQRPRTQPEPTVPPRPQLPQPGRERTKATGSSGPRGLLYAPGGVPGTAEREPFVAPPGAGAGGVLRPPPDPSDVQQYINRAVRAVRGAIPKVPPRLPMRPPLPEPRLPMLPPRPLPTVPLKVPMTGPSTPPIEPESFPAPGGATVPAKVLPPSRSGYDPQYDWYDAVDGQYSPGPAPFRLPGAETSGSRRGPEPYRLRPFAPQPPPSDRTGFGFEESGESQRKAEEGALDVASEVARQTEAREGEPYLVTPEGETLTMPEVARKGAPTGSTVVWPWSPFQPKRLPRSTHSEVIRLNGQGWHRTGPWPVEVIIYDAAGREVNRIPQSTTGPKGKMHFGHIPPGGWAIVPPSPGSPRGRMLLNQPLPPERGQVF